MAEQIETTIDIDAAPARVAVAHRFWRDADLESLHSRDQRAD
jgi:hypothetical protein